MGKPQGFIPKPGGRPRQAGKGGAGTKKAGKPKSVKNQIRSVQRLLKKPDLDPKMRARQEAKLVELREQATEHARKELERKYALRYHKVRFFERVKLERRLARLQAQLKGASAGGEGEPPVEELQAQVAQVQEDLTYVLHFPKGERYVSLLRNVDDPQAQAKLEAERARLRALVRRQQAEAAMLAEADEGAGLAAAAAAAGSGRGAKPGKGAQEAAAAAEEPEAEQHDDFFLGSDDDDEGGSSEEEEAAAAQRKPAAQPAAAAPQRAVAAGNKRKLQQAAAPGSSSCEDEGEAAGPGSSSDEEGSSSGEEGGSSSGEEGGSGSELGSNFLDEDEEEPQQLGQQQPAGPAPGRQGSKPRPQADGQRQPWKQQGGRGGGRDGGRGRGRGGGRDGGCGGGRGGRGWGSGKLQQPGGGGSGSKPGGSKPSGAVGTRPGKPSKPEEKQPLRTRAEGGRKRRKK